jgi:hypothetical protein
VIFGIVAEGVGSLEQHLEFIEQLARRTCSERKHFCCWETRKRDLWRGVYTLEMKLLSSMSNCKALVSSAPSSNTPRTRRCQVEEGALEGK